jgi:hypothetical protein
MDLSIIALVKAGDRQGLHQLLSTCADSVLDDKDHVFLPLDRTPLHFTFLFQNGRTPLIHACLSGKHEIMKILLKKGANPSSRDNVDFLCFSFLIILPHGSCCSGAKPF